MRLALALLIGSIGSVGMWSVVVVLPVVQAEFGATRGAVSLAFTLTMLGFGLGGVATGRITDRFGIVAAMALSIGFLGVAYVLAGLSTTLWQFIAVHFLIGLGTSATFAPLMAEASHWFERYRGLAVTIVASGNYVGGTIWPPLVNWGVQPSGWRTTHIAHRHVLRGGDDDRAAGAARRRSAARRGAITTTRRRRGSICGSPPIR